MRPSASLTKESWGKGDLWMLEEEGRRDEWTSPLIYLVLPLQYHCLSFLSCAIEDQGREKNYTQGAYLHTGFLLEAGGCRTEHSRSSVSLQG